MKETSRTFVPGPRNESNKPLDHARAVTMINHARADTMIDHDRAHHYYRYLFVFSGLGHTIQKNNIRIGFKLDIRVDREEGVSSFLISLDL